MYDILIQLGGNITEMYDMTLYELRQMIVSRKKGMANFMFYQAAGIWMLSSKDKPENPEDAYPGLFPPKKRYRMPEWAIKKYGKRNWR